MISRDFQDLKQFDTIFPEAKGLFVTSNERGIKKTWRKIPLQIGPNRVHVGCSGWYNLDIMASRETPYLIWLDIDASVRQLYEATRETIIECADRHKFASEISRKLKTFKMDITFRQRWISIEQFREIDELVQREVKKVKSWLGSDASYQHVKTAFLENRIVFLGANFTDVEKFSHIRTVLDCNHLVVDTLYISNVLDWCIDSSKSDPSNAWNLVKSVNALVNESTSIIYSVLVDYFRQNVLINKKFCLYDLTKPLNYNALNAAKNVSYFIEESNYKCTCGDPTHDHVPYEIPFKNFKFLGKQ